MEENFSVRLQKAMSMRNMKAIELSEKTGIPKSSLSEYIKGKYEAKQKGIYKLAKALDVSEGWLMGLDVSMERIEYVNAEEWSQASDDMLKKIGAIPLSDIQTVSIPLLGTVKAGYDYLAHENWEGTVEIKQELAKTGEFFALRIKGNSMLDALWENDIVAVKKQDFAEDKDIAVVLINR